MRFQVHSVDEGTCSRSEITTSKCLKYSILHMGGGKSIFHGTSLQLSMTGNPRDLLCQSRYPPVGVSKTNRLLGSEKVQSQMAPQFNTVLD